MRESKQKLTERVVLSDIQLFRERLSEKVHATIPKGIVGGFEFTVLSKKFERMAREAMDICLRLLKESNKVGSIATVSGTASCSYPILPFGIVACTFFPTTFLEIAVYEQLWAVTRRTLTLL